MSFEVGDSVTPVTTRADGGSSWVAGPSRERR